MIFNKLILTDKMVYLSANTNYFIHAGTACVKTSGSQKIYLTLCAVSRVCFFEKYQLFLQCFPPRSRSFLPMEKLT